MPRATITVDGKPFFGRVEEQKRFRAALQEVLDNPRGEDLPYVFLLYGDGGIGKTTLSRRFRDIATQENPFAGKFQVLWVDWEEERSRFSALQVGRAFIRPETVFEVLYTVAQRQDWGKHFSAYRQALEARRAAEKKAAEALAATGERNEFAALRGAGAAAIARILRTGLPVIGETGEKLARAFLDAGIQVGAEQAAELRAALENRLRARLSSQQFDLFINPNEGLARAFAEGLKRLTRRKPLLLVLDTYEIVDRADIWLRMAMKAAGPNIVWVISGRNDLRRSRQYGDEYFQGYADDFPRRLVSLEMGQLALADVRAYFAERVPQRPLAPEAAEAISRATRAIPLAMKLAAEMWERDIALEDIVGQTSDATPQGDIVAGMSERYLLHAMKSDEDRYALFALTLARGDVEILRAMLRPEDGRPDGLESRLHRLARDYASVYAAENRLHDEPALFFRQYLKVPLRRTSDEVQGLIRRAVAALRERLARLEADLPLLEERAQDEDWGRAVLDLTDYLFWLEEGQAWQWLLPRFVEGWAYNRDLLRGLLAVAEEWKQSLHTGGKKRLKALRVVEAWFSDPEEEADLFKELDKAARLNWLAGEGEAERAAILAWRRGRWLARQKHYEAALAAYRDAEGGLPPEGEALREHLAEAFEDIGEEMGWQRDEWRTIDALASSEAEYAYAKAIELGRGSSHLYHALGAVQSKLGKHQQSLENRKRALEIDPENVWAWNGLGNVYRDLGRHEDAIAAYQKAIDLDPKFAYPWNGLGNVYRDLGRHEDAIAAYQKASDLDPKDAYPWNGLGNVYDDLGRHEDAIAAYQKAIDLDPKFAYPWNGLGNVYDDLGRHEDAIAAYQKALTLPDSFGTPASAHTLAWNGLGNVYRALGRHEDAIAAYQKAIDLAPESTSAAFAYNNLAGIFIEKGRFAEARDALRQRIRLYPGNTFAPLISLGVLARHEGRPESEEHFRQVLAQWEKAWQDRLQSPAELLENKAIALLCLGEKDEALKALAEALRQRYPGDVIDFTYYELLRTAPNPPDGIEEAIAMLKEAENQ